MHIVILDAFTANPGDLDWSELINLGRTTIYDRTPRELTVERAREASVVLTNKVLLDRPTIAALPHLRYIGVLATGYNVVDLKAAGERGIVVTNVPAYSTMSVAQLVFGLLGELTLGVGRHSAAVHEGRWAGCVDFSFTDGPTFELDGLTLGLLGFGRIGQAVARIGLAYGMNVQVTTRTPQALPEGVQAVNLETLFAGSDVLSLHCPLTPATQGLVNAQRLASMKPTAYLINTSRGPVVNEADLAAALNEGRLAGAGLDVLSTEPPAADNPLLTADHCVITPHLAWATQAARQRLVAIATANVRAFAHGAPVNVVSA